MSYTYDSLTNDVIANMEEDSAEFVSALPSMVVRAQDYLQRRLDPLNIIRYAAVSASIGSRSLTLPEDLLVLKSLQFATSTKMVNLIEHTNEFLTVYWPAYTSVGTPKYYAPKDNLEIFLAPTPNAVGPATVEYIPLVTVLSSAAPSNWFAQYAGSAFFAAAMMYANLWTKNKGASAEWKAVADEAIMTINNEARRGRRSDSSDRSQGSPENNIGEGVR